MLNSRSLIVCHAALAAALLFCIVGCGEPAPVVVVYTSVDDVFAEPICKLFEKETGIQVKLVPDTEETKSTGLMSSGAATRYVQRS